MAAIVRFTVRPYRPSDREALMAIKLKKYQEWFADRPVPAFFEPDDPTALGVFVVANEDDEPVAAVGARRVAELGSVVDDGALTPHQLRHYLLPAWVKLGVSLYRQGYTTAFAKVSSPTPAWEHGLERIARFRKSMYPHYYFDLEAVARRLKAE